MTESDYNKIYNNLQDVRRILTKDFKNRNGDILFQEYNKLTHVMKTISDYFIHQEDK